MIGDKDPEDAFDASDPQEMQLDVLERVIESVRTEPDPARFDFRRTDALRIVAYLRRRRGYDQARLRRIREALEAL